MKRLLLSLLVGMSLNAASSLVELPSLAHRPARLFHDGDSFMVQHMGRTHQVANHDLDKELRGKDLAAIITMQRHGYFDVRPSVDGTQFSIEFKPRLKGGGVVGAWLGFWAGHLLVTVPSYAAIGVISAFTGPAAPATFATLSVYAAPAILATANVVGISAGLAAGVATGPV